MKTIFLVIILTIFSTWYYHGQNLIEFRVEVSADDSISEMGIRGAYAPLSWSKDLVMEDNDNDGIYTVIVEFPDSLTGKTLEYKFLKNDIWERQDLDNRKLEFTGKKQSPPLSKWKVHSDDFLFNKMSKSYFGKFVFIFHFGKNQGKTAKELVWEMIEYYNWSPNDWPYKPSDLLGVMESGQKGHKGGYFKIIENEPKQIKFIMGKYWKEWFAAYGPGLGMDKNGLIQGVSIADFETYYRTWIEYYCGKENNKWTFRIEEDGDSKWMVSIIDKE